ncbi:Zinc finger, C4 type (two domains) [Parelaphostrongylus tenuis]|uniref:Zinc finger, C4 type (Two domains) n=1 Tax=Parelaphostrongylus tenuis TaxID=148309 RepID=A0AAD5LYU6_PARTN|nr:Zinc finger, C4 type (two domains) [Parelaphostrongylus tenuis]
MDDRLIGLRSMFHGPVLFPNQLMSTGGLIPPHIAAAVALSMNHRVAQTSALNTSPFDPTTISVSSYTTLSHDSPPVAASPTLSCAVCGDVSSGKHYDVKLGLEVASWTRPTAINVKRVD